MTDTITMYVCSVCDHEFLPKEIRPIPITGKRGNAYTCAKCLKEVQAMAKTVSNGYVKAAEALADMVLFDAPSSKWPDHIYFAAGVIKGDGDAAVGFQAMKDHELPETVQGDDTDAAMEYDRPTLLERVFGAKDEADEEDGLNVKE